MFRIFKGIFLVVFFLFFCVSFIFAEDITITTYYPSPFGSYKNLNIYNQDESTTPTFFTQALTRAGLLITTDYTQDAYTPGIFWSTTNNAPTRPKAGIYLRETNTGTRMYFGTSNNYGVGITNDAVVINESGNVGIGTTSPNSPLDVGGYIQVLDQVSGPPVADCNEASEYGRMVVVTGVSRGLYVCLDNGWYEIKPGVN